MNLFVFLLPLSCATKRQVSGTWLARVLTMVLADGWGDLHFRGGHTDDMAGTPFQAEVSAFMVL